MFLIRNKSIWEVISGGNDIIRLGNGSQLKGLCCQINFSGSDQQKKVGKHVRGERNRVHLARMLKEEANVLLLDEPTNDLDVNTMRALEEALENFGGCVLVISHDRWFLTASPRTSLLLGGEPRGLVRWQLHEYEADMKARLGAAASTPTG